ncbi:hypothetical protein BFW01_g1843 [Lasiodiplodia theobromae]|uniref:Uncharacterized protein n=2 Tax=Lasiodiplodia TaxID=66739 RepID=A0A5N5D2M2_9PEZI|nr:uncharacterized protein LTHEOB_4493 [Lasiodiplodia theobromae]KAB2571943.1 hypothetical protein DBV05_g9404 [Lasiodiplodia theobromae]KAF4545841.1 hypothetical protein LTHEOB_4493 [Lasiodiplodia theobromae]KAF9630971.1 hypothetical protein BFW01_g1843 [Lasiodiplodia theobromae]KAK0647216.1 hypothetical protein DIS24_g7941 [Lasiodiplodia hormozganensis]
MLAIFPLLISAAAAFVLPEGLSDGFYRASIDERGYEIHELLSAGIDDANPTIVAQMAPTTENETYDLPAQLQKRAGTKWCGCGFTLDHAGCDAAVADMKVQVSGGVHIQAHLAYYSIKGGVVFFACNTGNGQLFMDAPTVAYVASEITNACGWYIAGTFARSGYPSEASGYMRYSSGLDFCGAAKSSSAHSC